MISEQLDRLNRLYDEGVLSDEEFAEAKSIVMRNATESFVASPQPTTIYGLTLNGWCAAMHFSQYVGYFSFGLGFVVPIMMWIISKDQSEEADNHGRVIINWLISDLIYLAISIILILAIIGIPMLLISLLLGLIYPMIGGLRANSGVLWRYPHSFTFLTVYEPVEYDASEFYEFLEEDDSEIQDSFDEYEYGK